MMRPFFKWAGGKYSIIERIKFVLPTGKRLIEPFCGSCAVSFNTDYPNYLLTDINKDLIEFYNYLKCDRTKFVNYCKELFASQNNNAKFFYDLREVFNETSNLKYKSAIFLYLNRHGFNGLCRYNSKGKFNVSFGKYKKPYFPEKEMREFIRNCERYTFKVSDFSKVMLSAKRGDVVYCDPPYEALSGTSRFVEYSSGGFGNEQHLELTSIARHLSKKGIPVLISNHNLEKTPHMYKGAKISCFEVQRYISCIGDRRKKVSELIAVF